MEQGNTLLTKVLNREPVDRPAVWLMRQAGRILPEYRRVRASVSGFKELVSSPGLAAEVTVQPVELLGVDAAILFSDILVIPEAMGLDYELIENVGPRFPEVISRSEDVDQLISGQEAADQLAYVYHAIHKTQTLLERRVPLIGFSGAPWTLFCYMVEGGGSKTFSRAKAMMYGQPKMTHHLLQRITDTIISYLQEKIDAGIDVLQLFDSWAGVLSDEWYSEFGLRYLKQICDAIDQVPLIVFSKGAWYSLEKINALACTALGLDWSFDPETVRSIVGVERILQGNLDPSILLTTPQIIQESTLSMLKRFGRNHIANLGHGVYPNTPVENVLCFIETIKSYKY